MSCRQCVGIETQFNDKVARRELEKFRKRGGKTQTRILVSQLLALGIEDRSLLDIGGGIGAIQHALAEQGAVKITNVDASSAYLQAAREEATEKGYTDRVTYISGDFVDLAPDVSDADFVTMDRVVCCYHDLSGLLKPAAERARLCLGLVFPRENWVMRAGAIIVNLALRIGRSDFRAFVHPHREIEAVAAEAGLLPGSSTMKGLWRVATFVRAQDNVQG